MVGPTARPAVTEQQLPTIFADEAVVIMPVLLLLLCGGIFCLHYRTRLHFFLLFCFKLCLDFFLRDDFRGAKAKESTAILAATETLFLLVSK